MHPSISPPGAPGAPMSVSRVVVTCRCGTWQCVAPWPPVFSVYAAISTRASARRRPRGRSSSDPSRRAKGSSAARRVAPPTSSMKPFTQMPPSSPPSDRTSRKRSSAHCCWRLWKAAASAAWRAWAQSRRNWWGLCASALRSSRSSSSCAPNSCTASAVLASRARWAKPTRPVHHRLDAVLQRVRLVADADGVAGLAGLHVALVGEPRDRRGEALPLPLVGGGEVRRVTGELRRSASMSPCVRTIASPISRAERAEVRVRAMKRLTAASSSS